jgi:hypothetical protein
VIYDCHTRNRHYRGVCFYSFRSSFTITIQILIYGICTSVTFSLHQSQFGAISGPLTVFNVTSATIQVLKWRSGKVIFVIQ